MLCTDARRRFKEGPEMLLTRPSQYPDMFIHSQQGCHGLSEASQTQAYWHVLFLFLSFCSYLHGSNDLVEAVKLSTKADFPVLQS